MTSWLLGMRVRALSRITAQVVSVRLAKASAARCERASCENPSKALISMIAMMTSASIGHSRRLLSSQMPRLTATAASSR